MITDSDGYDEHMMGVTHRVTGLCAGAYIAWGVREVALPAPAPVYACVVALAGAMLLTTLAGYASLWADLDHHGARATRTYGLLTGLIHQAVHAASCNVYDLTATALDKKAGNFRGHRGLSHFGVTALGTGGLIGALVWVLAERRPVLVLGVIAGFLVGLVADWVWTDVVGSLIGVGVAVAVWFVATPVPTVALAGVVGVLVWLLATGVLGHAIGGVAGLVTGALSWMWLPVPVIDWTVVGTETGLGIGLGTGLAITIGMLAHSFGDAATKTGVPLLWPLMIKGRRYYPVHIRSEGMRLHTGQSDWEEMKLRGWSWALSAVAVIGWWPGLWPFLWALIPWPWTLVG